MREIEAMARWRNSPETVKSLRANKHCSCEKTGTSPLWNKRRAKKSVISGTIPSLIATFCRTLSISLLACISCYFPLASNAATLNAASVAYQDVYNAVQAAQEGDTVIIPPGTASWNSTLNITKGITLQGATTVTGDHTTAMSAIDSTVILDTIVGSNAFSPVVQVTLNNPSSFRITGVTFQYDPNVTAKNQNGAVIVGGTSNNFRLDHCHFSLLYGGHLEITGSIFGVIDHTIFDVRSGT